MPAPATSTTLREILAQDLEMPTDEVLKRARARGVTAPEKSVKDSLYNLRSELRKRAKKAGAMPAPAAAKTTKPATTVTPVASPAPDLAATLANVALVNTVVGASGGVDQARKVAE